MPEPLTNVDIELVFERMIYGAILDGVDPRAGTAETARYLRSRLSVSGSSGSSPADGPFSNGENAEYWTFDIRHEKRGFSVQVIHHVREGNQRTILREGLLSWNNLANRATLKACERREVVTT